MTIRNDFPDFGVAPTFLTSTPPANTVTISGSPIATFDIGNYQYGVVWVQKDSTLVQSDLAFQWMGPVGFESSIAAQSQFAIIQGGTIVIPFQALTPTLRIADVVSSAYPYDIGINLTLLSNPIYQHGFPGGIFAINDVRLIVMSSTETFTPDACGPGQHILSVDTGSSDFDVDLTIYPRYNNPITLRLVTGGAGSFTNFAFTVPATQWTLDVTNNDADGDFTIMCARTPNPN